MATAAFYGERISEQVMSFEAAGYTDGDVTKRVDGDRADLAEAERIMPRGAALDALVRNSPPPPEWWDEKLPF
jgi:hypothetical protein